MMMANDLFAFPSPLERYRWHSRDVYVKRDDLLHPILGGNKARKFEALLELNLRGKTLLSYGGNQSNAMATLSYIAKMRGCDFVYVTSPLSGYLQKFPQGNLAYALENGMQLEILDVASDFPSTTEAIKNKALQIAKSLGEQAVFIPQGGACELAKKGIGRLALELRKDLAGLKNPAVFYVSGSGASAGYLAGFIPCVFSVNAAGDASYLKTLFENINAGMPEMILSPKTKIPFAKPDWRLVEIYREWLDLGVEFDLIYDCLGWLCVSENLKLFEDRDIVFIHSGGLLGNLTQKLRYQRRFQKYF
ncbi:pyridoxal-phosphate dependent enzyme [Helicobacter sp. 11S02596-1]|uniref:pyridoxal-phosphate dependent enzyme n=1 Tax=Helicobacter sp. 11S02596-1 TaxID=1476194 RepID=UPI000BA6F959|nr:pyridoxal-phosphate dependent enzyme [Helicobacter sp. 11S02596-1]PAF44488.1 hypothetical protein BJI48_02910 [Helicobacter sp. 11S02596-1]